jgi:glycosyltransferase involved in cell wall biosynthesis
VPLSSFEQSSIAAERFAPKRPVVVFMGRLTMQKGAEYFLALARKVLDTVPSALFIIAGDGDMYHDLLLKTADKRLSASLLFSGFVRDVQRNRLLNRADVFVMPSLSEPFGLVALEAAQRNTPVIVSKNAGVSEVMPSSIQVDFWDIEKMAQEIERLVTKPEVHTTVITNKLRDLRQVTWENAAKRLQEVYKRAFRGR